MSRTWLIILTDALLTIAAFIVALMLRFEFNIIVDPFLRALRPVILVGVVVKPLVLYLAGVYKTVWRYATTRDFFRLSVAIIIGSVIISLVAFLLFPKYVPTLPRSILVLEGVLSLIFLGGLPRGYPSG